jgi:hypothetical protein
MPVPKYQMRNWINLFESVEDIMEAKVFTSSPYAGSQEQTLYKNPTLSDLNQMLQKRDLRGITDGTNLFVWDADCMIHGQATWAIAAAGFWEGQALPKLNPNERVSPRYDPQKDCMFFFDPTSPDRALDSPEWVGTTMKERIEMHIPAYRLAPHVALAIPGDSFAHMQQVPAMVRVMRNADLIEDEIPVST